MFGLLISFALAVVLVVSAVGALRRGEVALGGGPAYRRGHPLFWAFTVAALVGGVAIASGAAWAFWDAESAPPAPPRLVERDGFRLWVPGSWQPLPDFPEQMGAATSDMLGLGGDGSELVVMWPAPQPRPPGERPLRELAEALRDPSIAYERWEARDEDGVLVVDAMYPSPRGAVLARHLIVAAGDDRVRAATATCSTEGDLADCEAVIGSFGRDGEMGREPDGEMGR